MSDVLRILAVFGLVGANAFFVMGEYAIVTARRGRIQAQADAGRRGAETVLRLMDDPVRVISTVQVGITALGILTGAIGEPLVRDLLGDGLPEWAGFAIAFLAVTYLSVVFGELVPKALTLEHAETVAMVVGPPIDMFGRVLRPIVWVLQKSGAAVLRPFGIRDVTVSDTVSTPEELRGIVDEAEQAGAIPRTQEELLHRVFEFGGREARDVMIPAAEVVWLDAALSAGDAVDRLRDTPHRRFPVGEGSIDNQLGAVHAHEILGAAADDPARPVRELAVPAPVVPPTKDLGKLLKELRAGKDHLAFVVSEYGQTSGIVTVEDIVEELVGDIQDEYDLAGDMEQLGPGVVEAAGWIPATRVAESVGFELGEEGPKTIGGVAFEEIGRRPRAGDEVEVDGARLTVLETDGARIARMRIESTGHR